MTRHSIASKMFALTLAAGTMVAPLMAHASDPKVLRVEDTTTTTSTMKKPAKMVHLTLRNDSANARELMVGDKVVTIVPKETLKVEAPIGTRVVNNVATARDAAGAVVVQIDKALDGATVALN